MKAYCGVKKNRILGLKDSFLDPINVFSDYPENVLKGFQDVIFHYDE